MEFTKSELQGIVSMCRHERALMDTIETMIPGLRVHQAQAITAAIAAKADAMAEALDKAERTKAVKEAAEAKETEK